MTPARLAAALRNHAQGLYCLEAAAELLIAQSWLHRADFTSQFVTFEHGLPGSQPTAIVDWPAAITALDAGDLPCSASGGCCGSPPASPPSISRKLSPASTTTTFSCWSEPCTIRQDSGPPP